MTILNVLRLREKEIDRGVAIGCFVAALIFWAAIVPQATFGFVTSGNVATLYSDQVVPAIIWFFFLYAGHNLYRAFGKQ